MCIIVYKPAGVEAPAKEILETCFYNNPDGAGMMKIDIKNNGGVVHEKGFFDFEKFYSRALEHYSNKEQHVAYHFRIATSGRIDKNNCHPFVANSHISNFDAGAGLTPRLMHNGVLSNFDRFGSKHSDTYHFVKEIITPLSRMHQKEHFCISQDKEAAKIIKTLTRGSKILIFDANGVVKTGEWIKDNGVFYSNTSYQRNTFKAFNFDETENILEPFCEGCELSTSCLKHGPICWNEDQCYNTNKQTLTS